jgi:poly-gamma-glutamate capsule biosynthesis protein CapA/YwtB (metallophosphatase superfamily)
MSSSCGPPVAATAEAVPGSYRDVAEPASVVADRPGGTLRLMLAGDVMTGRGIDQVLPHPGGPRIHEGRLRSALDYVALAERAHGPIPRPADFGWVWGDVPAILRDMRPDVRIVNLETSITTSEAAAPKGINYRMHPDNAPVLSAAGLDCCTLANNHVLDWGEAGLLETLATLERAGIRTAGAGRDLHEARMPALLPTRAGRVVVFAFATPDAGVPRDWAAGTAKPGIHLLEDLSDAVAARVALDVQAVRQTGDVVVASIHWGGNWGWGVPAAQRRFAHALIDRAGVDVVHGHSSHHPKAIEVRAGRPILYGCGDLLTDYEGIGGYEAYRSDLVALYLPTIALPARRLARLDIVPLRIRRFQLRHAGPADRDWLCRTLDRECRRFGLRVADRDGTLALEWPPA